jgi:2-methylcitrate dehydratase
MSVGVALAAGKLWSLNEEQLANAASLALVPNLPLGVSRWGALSMMKGGATAFSVRSGIFAAMLAKEGFTSSPDPYEGQCGLFEAIGRFELQLPVYRQMRIVEMSYIKPIPAENNTIGVLECAPEIRDRMAVDDIESIDIELATGLDEHLADEAKYDPKTRESADHSFPFMLARALVDGGISFASYTAEKIADPAIRPLMRKIRVHGNAEMKAMMTASRARDAAPGPEAKPARVRVTSVTGGEFTRELLGHSGHPQRPAQERRGMLDRKLDLCARHAGLNDETREQIRRTWWEIRSVGNIGEAIGTLAWR